MPSVALLRSGAVARDRSRREKTRETPSRLGQWLVRLGLRSAVATFGRLSPRARVRLATVVGNLAAWIVPIRRRVVEENLKIAFPEWSDARRRKVVRESYVTLVANGLSAVAMARLTFADVDRLTEQPVKNVEKLRALKESGRGFILVTAHFGDWELGGAFLTNLGLDLTDVAKPLKNPAAESFVSGIRSRFRIKVITTDDNPIRLVRHLKKGGTVSLFTDQNVRKDGIFVPFFGRDASTAAGAGFLAYRLGVPVIHVVGFRTKDGGLRARIDDPIEPDLSKPADEEIRRITRYSLQCLEETIREDPGQYFWFHRRWKTRPPAGLEGASAAPQRLESRITSADAGPSTA